MRPAPWAITSALIIVVTARDGEGSAAATHAQIQFPGSRLISAGGYTPGAYKRYRRPEHNRECHCGPSHRNERKHARDTRYRTGCERQPVANRPGRTSIGCESDLFEFNGQRTLRAAAAGDGTLEYDAPGSINWTSTYTGLNSTDMVRAVGGTTTIANAPLCLPAQSLPVPNPVGSGSVAPHSH